MKRRSHDLPVRLAAILLAVSPAPIALAAKPSDAAALAQQTTTFNFVQMPVRTALGLIAEEGHFNLVLSDSVQGTVTLHLDHATWRQALDVVLRLRGLRARVEGTTLWVDYAAAR